MKVKKFPQSCILIETNGTKILIDPSSVKYDEKFKKDWKTADAILITHRHSDHINASVVNTVSEKPAPCATRVIGGGDTKLCFKTSV